MSSGTNQERIEQNNLKLAQLKIKVDDLPDIPVKLFTTIEEMQADLNPSEGDLAVVYKEEIQPVTEESEFDNCIFPNEVVLDEAFTDELYGRFRAVDQSVRFDGMVDMSSSSFRFDGYVGSSQIRIQYTSSDGITYTRTDGGEELQEFGTTIKWEPNEEFNNVIGNFMQISGNHFGGLYEYNGFTYIIISAQLDATADYVYGKTFYGKNGVEVGTLGNINNLTKSQLNIKATVYNKISVLNTIETSLESCFKSNIDLITIPLINTSSVTNMGSMFYGCSNLVNVPLLNTSNSVNMNGMFNNCSSLSTESLNNILYMCANTNNNYKYGKTLASIGLTQAQATTCQSLSNYQAFLNAGWTTGY